MDDKVTVDTSWFDEFGEGFEAVFSEMQNEHLQMKFALNMICELCKNDASLTMGPIHQMALFGLGYSHEESGRDGAKVENGR